MGAEDLFPDMSEESDLSWIFRSGAGWLAGGPLGAIVGANLGWGAVAANLAVNFGLGFGLAALGIAVPVVGFLAIAAAIGALQIGFGQDKIKAKIAKRVTESFQEKLEDNQEILDNFAKNAKKNLSEIAGEIEKATSGMMSQLSEMSNKSVQETFCSN